MPLERLTLDLLAGSLNQLDAGFASLPESAAATPGADRMPAVLTEVADRLHDNYPYFHPLYAGQMLRPPHPVARAAYALAMWINPNNHALDGGRASSAMEKEAVAEIAAMFGWDGTSRAPLTVAAPWRISKRCGSPASCSRERKSSRRSNRTTRMSASAAVLRLPFEKVAVDKRGRMDCAALEARVSRGHVGCVVATLGSTGTGAVDPLPKILELSRTWLFRVHVDAAYGGYFTLADNLGPSAREAFDRIGEADSIVIDPHKHGLQPYGCGCVLFRDPRAGVLYKHDSPYTYFLSNELHLGEISIECSRPGAVAVALWATQRLLPLKRGGEFADGLSGSRRAALAFAGRLAADPRFVVPFEPELDIVVWAPRARSASTVSAASQWIFDEAARRQLYLALIQLPVSFFADAWPQLEKDRENMLCLRSVLMKPEHESWINEIAARLNNTLEGV